MGTNFVLLAAGAGAVYLSRILYRDVFTPLCTYVSIWLACLLLFRLRLVDYYGLEIRTVILIGTSILAFVAGCIIAGCGKDPSEDGCHLSGTLHHESFELVIKVLFALNLVGTLVFAYRMNSSYGLTTYITDPGIIRGDFDEWGRVGLLALLMMLDYPLVVCSWVHYLLTKKWRWFTIVSLLLVLVQTYLRTDRGSLTVYVISMLSLWLYWNRWRSLNWRILRRLGVIAALLLTYFLAVGLLYGKLVSEHTDVFDQRDFRVNSEAGLVLATPYIYATASVLGFQEAMRDVDDRSWGTHTFFPVARALYGLGILHERPEGFTFDFYLVPVPVNTYTHLIAYYQDFGIAGVILLPLILGYAETCLYLRMKASPTLLSLGASSAFTALNLFSVFVPLITSLSFWYYFATLAGISRFCCFSEAERDLKAGEAALCP
jgi:oligosaccharide repeat unit polymerase